MVQRKKTFFFDIAFIAYIIFGCLRDSNLDNVSLRFYLSIISVLFSMFSIAQRYPLTLGHVLLLIFVTGFSVYFKVNNIDPYFIILISFLVFAAYRIPVRHLIKVLFITTIVSTSINTLLAFMGIIENKVYYHDIGGYSYETFSFGFKYYSFFGFRAITIVLSYLYLNKDKCSILTLVTLLLFSIVVYFFSTTRLQLTTSVFLLLLYLLIYKFHFSKLKSKIWKFVGLIAFPCAFLFYNLIPFSFVISPDIYEWWDQQFSNRMSQTLAVFLEYPVSLWGNEIEMIGALQAEETGEGTFYVDSGYAFWLIVYGVVFSIMVVIAHSVIFYRAYKANDKLIYIWCSVLVIVYLIQDFFTYSYFSPLILLLFADFSSLPVRTVSKEVDGKILKIYTRLKNGKDISAFL